MCARVEAKRALLLQEVNEPPRRCDEHSASHALAQRLPLGRQGRAAVHGHATDAHGSAGQMASAILFLSLLLYLRAPPFLLSDPLYRMTPRPS